MIPHPTQSNEAIPPRSNDSFVAKHERNILLTIAKRLPSAVTPDRLTTFGIFGALIVIIGYALSNQSIGWLWLANLGLVIHWLGDSLDGTVARFRKIERPRYGFYLDQVIDTLGNTLIALGVGLAPGVRMDFVLFTLACYHMLSIQVYVRTVIDREFHLAVGRLGPTEMRIGIIVLNLGILSFGTQTLVTWPITISWWDAAIAILSIGLLGLYASQMIRHLRRLNAQDPLVPASENSTHPKGH